MSKETRFCLGLLLPLCVLFWSLFSIQVNASDYPLGSYIYEPFYVDDEYMGTWDIFDMPNLLISSGDSDIPDEVQQTISVSSMDYVFRYSNGTVATQGNFAFGVSYGYNHVNNCTFNIFNDGEPLFSDGGTMYLFIFLDGYSGNVKVTYSTGVQENLQLHDNASGGENYYCIIPNSEANLCKIEVSATCNPDLGYGTYLGISLLKYGYILDEQVVPEENHSKNIFELLKNFIENFSNTISNAIKNAITVTVEGLFVPDEEFLKSRTEALKTQFWDSMGLLAYPVAFLQSLMDDLADCTPTNAVFTFPCIEWEGIVVIPETDFDLYSFFYDNGFGFLIDACRFFTSVVLVGAFLVFCQDTLRRILDDN